MRRGPRGGLSTGSLTGSSVHWFTCSSGSSSPGQWFNGSTGSLTGSPVHWMNGRCFTGSLVQPVQLLVLGRWFNRFTGSTGSSSPDKWLIGSTVQRFKFRFTGSTSSLTVSPVHWFNRFTSSTGSIAGSLVQPVHLLGRRFNRVNWVSGSLQ